MVRRWNQWRNPWDREYARRGRLWRGSADATFLAAWLPPPQTAVEVGCGDGKFLHALTGAGYRAVGLDSSRYALRLVSAPSLQGDARRLPFRDGSVPLLTSRFLLGALSGPDRRGAAAELTRVLGPRGTLLAEEFSTADFRYGRGRLVEPNTFERNEGIRTHYFEDGELASLFPRLESRRAERVERGLRIAGLVRPRVSWRVIFQPSASRDVSASVDGA